MSFDRPELIALLLLAIPIVIAYLYKSQPRIQTVSSLLLLRALEGVDVQRRWPPFRELVCLMLVLVTLGALVFELATRPRGDGPGVVVLYDNSSSMGSTIPGTRTSRSEVAQQHLRRLVANHDADNVTVVGTAPAQILFSGTVLSARLDELLPQLEPKGVAANVSGVIAPFCEQEPVPEIVIIGADNQSLEDLGCPVSRVGLGDRGDNLGVTGLTARRLDQLGLVEIAVEINGAPEGSSGVSFALDGQSLGTTTLQTGRPHLLRVEVPTGGRFVAKLTQLDQWREDDYASLVFAEPKPFDVQNHTRRSRSMLDAVLRANPSINFLDADETISDVGLVFVDTGTQIPSGVHTVHFEPGVQSTSVVGWAEDHPLLRRVDLAGVAFDNAKALQVADSDTVLIETDIGVVGAVVDNRVRFGFDMSGTDLGLRIAFVHLISNLIDWANPPALVDPAVGILSTNESTFLDGAAAQTEKNPRLWRLGLLLAVLLLLVEWLLQPRRRRT